jgi:hypothetical protein
VKAEAQVYMGAQLGWGNTNYVLDNTNDMVALRREMGKQVGVCRAALHHHAGV